MRLKVFKLFDLLMCVKSGLNPLFNFEKEGKVI